MLYSNCHHIANGGWSAIGSIEEVITSQSFTFIDPAGNQAQYTVYDVDRRNEYHWTTEHGDRGFDLSYAEAQSRARMALKESMAVRRRTHQRQY